MGDVEEACVGGDVTCEVGSMVVTAPCADTARFQIGHRLVDAVNHVVVAAFAANNVVVAAFPAKGVVVSVGGVVDSAAAGAACVVNSGGAAVDAVGAAVAWGALDDGTSVGACKVLEANADTMTGNCLSRFGISSRKTPELPTAMA